jgi:hypothetical protein
VASSDDGATLVAVSESGLILGSDNSGATWSPADAPAGARWVSVAVSADGSKCLAAVAHGGIFRSIDSGATWTMTSAPTNEPWSAVASSADGATLAAAVAPGLIYVSGDSGVSWATSTVPVLSWTSLASSADGSRLVATAPLSGIYISTNSGMTWDITVAPTNEAWFSVASSAGGTNLIAAGTYGGIYTSSDSGSSWIRNEAPGNRFYTVGMSADGNQPVAAVYNGGIYIPGTPPAGGNSTYQGLFQDTNGVSVESSGFFSATISPKKAAFSAKLQLGRKSYPFSGPVPTSGSSSNLVNTNTITTNTITRKGLTPLVVTLDFATAGDSLQGTVSGGVWVADLAANRAAFSKTNPPAQAGRKYTIAFPGLEGSLPGIGAGIGSVSVDGSGRIAFGGVLSDGTKVVQRTFLSRESQWPFYASLYSGKGCILGWLTLTEGESSDIAGRVDWLKPAQADAKSSPAGFTNAVELLGSLYQFTNGIPVLHFSNAVPALNVSTGQVWFAGGDLSGSFTNRIELGADNKILNLSSNKLTIKLMNASGLFKGVAVDPIDGQTISFSGAVLQRQSAALGFFTGTTQNGGVIVGSEP